MHRIWKFLRDPKNLAVIGMAGTGIAAVADGLWAACTHFHDENKPRAPTTAITIGQDVHTGDHSPVTISPTVTVGASDEKIETRIAPRQRITRPLRLRGGVASRNSANHELPRAEWIEIPVPPIISEAAFALAAERLQSNKKHAPRRTITPSVVQGLASCAKCGYGLCRTSTRSSARTIHYYRCLGSDGWRRLGGPVRDNRPARQDLLDEVV